MRLLFNLSMLGPRPTGLGVYSENCAKGLGDRFDIDLIAGGGMLPRGRVALRAPKSVSIGSGRLAAVRRQLWMRSLSLDPDVLLYSPTHHGLPRHYGQVITVHDLICLRFPAQHRPQYLFFKFGLPRLLKLCKAVITVSETTRQDVAETYGYPLEKIHVVPNGVDASAFWPDVSAQPSEPYLLMVGARYEHKNVEEVLEVASCWRDNYRLIITSCGGRYRQRLESKVLNAGLSDRVEFKDYLSREELLRLYQGASALVYPSKWEGFGIPPLESLACGVPVIASDIPVHREVLGSAVQFVSLGDADSWAKAIGALGDEAYIKTQMDQAQTLLKKYTWDHSVDALERALLAVEPRLEASRSKLAAI